MKIRTIILGTMAVTTTAAAAVVFNGMRIGRALDPPDAFAYVTENMVLLSGALTWLAVAMAAALLWGIWALLSTLDRRERRRQASGVGLVGLVSALALFPPLPPGVAAVEAPTATEAGRPVEQTIQETRCTTELTWWEAMIFLTFAGLVCEEGSEVCWGDDEGEEGDPPDGMVPCI